MSRKEERYYYDILDKIELMIKEDLKMAETASPNNQPSTLHYHLGRISSVGIIRDFIREELMSEDEEQ